MIIFKRVVWSGFSEQSTEELTITLEPGEGMIDALRVLRKHRLFWRSYSVDDPNLERERVAAMAALIAEDNARVAGQMALIEARRAGAWSEEKQRGSRVDWFSLLPHPVARKQIAWERSRTAARMRSCGFAADECAARFGVGVERLRQIINAYTPVSPAERHLQVSF